ncbi:carbohydrate-binding module family 50 protein [Xylaria telfairii]|nr:carbohydrate-binding module family 50 protein [Xylaria telfairii]
MWKTSCLLALGLYFQTSEAVVWFTSPDTLPSNVTAACVKSLGADLACDSSLTRLRPFLYPPQSFLQTVCTQACSAALEAYEHSVTAVCQNQTYDSRSSTGFVGISTIPQLLRYTYGFNCLKDAVSGQYCKVLAANAAGILPNQSNLADPSAGGGGLDGCSDCGLKVLQFQAGSPFYANANVTAEYRSATSSCGSTSGYPLTTTTAEFSPQMPSPTVSACTGRTYKVQPNDTCASISKTEKIGTSWLLLDNSLPAYCAGFPTSGTLCLNHTCPTYTVKANDSCTGIAASNNATLAQIFAWNPVLDLACSNINKSLGLEFCIGSPGQKYTAPSVSISPVPTTATAPVPIPTDIANGTTINCGNYYQASPGDYCSTLLLKFGISLSDFQVLNPEINSNCTNLFAYESYCILPVGNINSYPGSPGFSLTASLSGTATPFGSLPSPTYIPTPFPGYNRTYAPNTRTDCQDYLNGADYQEDLSGTFYENNCQLATDAYGISLVNLGIWNPSLGDANLANCTFASDLWYCIGWGGDVSTDPGDGTNEPTPVANGTTSDCTTYVEVTFRDNCTTVLAQNNITLATFYALNPEVGPDCSKFTTDVMYCISGTPAPPSNTTTSPTPPGPTQSGQPANCNAWYVARDGDACATVEGLFGITDAQFHAWNPAVSSNCASGFWVDEAYCVGISVPGGDPTMTTSSTPALPTPPAPTQTGQPANCNKWFVATKDSSCEDAETAGGVTDAQFHAWNPAVSSDCRSGFWVGEAYCVGVSGPGSSTITTSPTPSRPTPPAPTQTGQPANCNKWFVAKKDSSCEDAEAAGKITGAQFHAWNPAVSNDCRSGFWVDEAYCIGVSS